MNISRVLTMILLCTAGATWAADPHPEGTHIMAFVVRVSSLEQIMEGGENGVIGHLRGFGIDDADVTDGSVAYGIVYCCGGNISRETMFAFFVPPEFRVADGDVAEIRLGRSVSKKERKKGLRGTINRAVRVRDSFRDEPGSCRWVPENDRLWMRVLYCDWMLSEGWEYRDGLSKAWYKPAPETRAVGSK